MPDPKSILEYTPETTDLAERTLLEVWSSLGDYKKHLVLVGGLTPGYLVNQSKVADNNKHCGTIDVDLGISLPVRTLKTYEGIAKALKKQGFMPGKNEKGNDQKHSFVNAINGHNVIVDFLTVQYQGPANSKMRALEDSLSAIQTEGLGLAFNSPLEVNIKGELFSGGIRAETVNVCRPIPFIVLKALACEKRNKRKDAYDLIYVLTNYEGGVPALASEITREEKMENSFKNAIASLKKNFETPAHNGPVRYDMFLNDDSQAIQAYAAVQEFLKALNL